MPIIACSLQQSFKYRLACLSIRASSSLADCITYKNVGAASSGSTVVSFLVSYGKYSTLSADPGTKDASSAMIAGLSSLFSS